jgi:hypothetical protein
MPRRRVASVGDDAEALPAEGRPVFLMPSYAFKDGKQHELTTHRNSEMIL